MYFIKLKSKEYLEKNHFIKNNAIWIDENEYIERYEKPDEKLTRLYRVIDYETFNYNYKVKNEIFGKVITNNKEYKYKSDNNIIFITQFEDDTEFKWVFGWAGEEITPKENPEYFI